MSIESTLYSTLDAGSQSSLGSWDAGSEDDGGVGAAASSGSGSGSGLGEVDEEEDPYAAEPVNG